MRKTKMLSLLCLAIILCISGCQQSKTANPEYTANRLNNYRTREPVLVYAATFKDAPNAHGSGEVFTTAFKQALQTVSSKVGAR